ncbi:MAG: thiosulfate/3-mercaptopyruvate sulfurtransferase [Chitinophagales bacterium]|jgi:thiosulfate/3-mercaptopyruvate sulfurtransferase
MFDSSQLCSVTQIETLIDHSAVSVLDSSWYLPLMGVDSQRQFKQQHIPSAQFFDVDLICDRNSNLPHILPSTVEFFQVAGGLGITNDSQVVVYDSAGLFSAARV